MQQRKGKWKEVKEGEEGREMWKKGTRKRKKEKGIQKGKRGISAGREEYFEGEPAEKGFSEEERGIFGGSGKVKGRGNLQKEKEKRNKTYEGYLKERE